MTTDKRDGVTGFRPVILLNAESRRSIPFALRKIADEVETEPASRQSAVVVLYSPEAPLQIFSNGVELPMAATVGVLQGAIYTLLRWAEIDAKEGMEP